MDLGALGFKVRFLCLEESPVAQNLLGHPKVEVIPIGFRPRNYLDWKMRKELRRQIDQGVNLIHTHQTSLLGSIVPWVWDQPQVALIATRHIFNNHDKKDFFHRMIYRRVDSLIVMSQALRQNILKTHTIGEQEVKVVPLGLDFGAFNPNQVDRNSQRKKWGILPDELLIGLVGRIDPAKGHATFIQAAAALMKSLRPGEKLKFILVGEETLGNANHYQIELKQMVAHFCLENHFIFAGYHHNIPKVMRSLDIFVMPSRQEAFGLVAIEAMAMECPVIISRGGSSEEIIGNEEYGLSVNPEDAFDLQRQIQFLVDHPEIRSHLGKRGRAHVQAHYNQQVRVAQTLNLYQKALRRRQRA